MPCERTDLDRPRARRHIHPLAGGSSIPTPIERPQRRTTEAYIAPPELGGPVHNVNVNAPLPYAASRKLMSPPVPMPECAPAVHRPRPIAACRFATLAHQPSQSTNRKEQRHSGTTSSRCSYIAINQLMIMLRIPFIFDLFRYSVPTQATEQRPHVSHVTHEL